VEKIVCALWASGAETAAAFGERLRETLPAALIKAGARQVRLNVRDQRVDPARSLIIRWQTPQPDAVLQFWLPSANAMFREAVDAMLSQACDRFESWLVAESTIIPNRSHPPEPGAPTWGWAQATFITFRPDMSWTAAVEHWHDFHTRVAIETQSNLEYIQNIIVRPLTPGATPYSAFVEECFPPTAMTDPMALLDASGDDARFRENEERMMSSCTAFLDFARMDVIPSSQYDFAYLD
jgi:EthD domain